MKIMTIFGSTAEVIKLSLVLKVLDQHCDHVTVSTLSASEVSDALFRDLEVRPPDFTIISGAQSMEERASQTLKQVDEIITQANPDRLLVVGGATGSQVISAAFRLKIPVFLMQAGERCYDKNDDEEVARQYADRSSSVLMSFTDNCKQNLLREGADPAGIFQTGLPLKEVLDTFALNIEASEVLTEIDIRPFDYFLAIAQKAENIESAKNLVGIFDALSLIASKFGKQVVFIANPSVAESIAHHGIVTESSKVRILKQRNFFDFIKLEMNALAVLTDNSTIQQECCILGVPNITLRKVTECPETVECGSSILSGIESDAIVRSVELAIAQPVNWIPPAEYLIPNVSQTISRILLLDLQ